ncbi:ABC transporter ATP-binding protein [Kocuria rhizophila]|uniref:ABC transporter ATP-binding protein n=1 Tax=Kocuria rhizophila TaxID=72000 RepID=UPI0002D2AB80|nr:ABC transporter ATP-binding protein [Kocuria rhizophila]ASE12298.2 glutathione ABC transporter ATP-binding protein [Kocuria rhizophila]VEH75563.1 Glutathione import ATP-binding protein GsiA [Kocuria rhizophila]
MSTSHQPDGLPEGTYEPHGTPGNTSGTRDDAARSAGASAHPGAAASSSGAAGAAAGEPRTEPTAAEPAAEPTAAEHNAPWNGAQAGDGRVATPDADAAAQGAPGGVATAGGATAAGAAGTTAAGTEKRRGRRAQRSEPAARRGRARTTVARGEPVLSVRGLSVDFGVDREWVPAAIDLNYDVAAGEVLAIVGESGSGKSASSMSMLGLLPSNARVSGSAKLGDTELIGLRGNGLRRVRGEEIAVIFQEPMTALNPVYTVGQQIVETIRLHRDLSPAEATERAMQMLTMVELPDPEKAFRSYPHQLSGGQRQRAMIAQSLSCDPKLLIADEPTTALDVTVQAEILDLIRNLKDQLDSAVILITHDMGVVADLADKIAVMQKGLIVEQGSAEQIFSSPQHPYTISLLESVPHLGEGSENDESVDLAAVLERSIASPVVDRTAAEEASMDTLAQRVVAPVLQLKDVAIEYPKQGRNPAFRAVEGVSITVASGETVGLVGESGSGKTTIGRAAVGLLPVVEGSLIVDGVELAGASRATLNKVRKDVGMVFQDPSSSLNPRLPIGESIGEPMYLAGVAKGGELQHRIEQLLDQVRLPRNYRNRYPHELSGGQKQRVGIARALSLKPKLLVADEPTSALDVSVQATVLDLFEELQAEMGFACLFVTHDLAVIDRLANRIVVMQHGHIVEQGSREAVLRHPEQEYTKRLLAAVPVPSPEAQRVRRELRQQMVHHVS